MIVLLFASFFVHAFTLVSPSPPIYQTDEVIIDMANDECSNTGYTRDEIFDLAIEAAEDFWNKIPTVRIDLVRGSVQSFSSDGQTSSSSFSQLAQDNHIIIGCNDDVVVFDGLGVGAIGGLITSSSGAKGSVLINDHSTSAVPSISRSQMVALLAHEMGHGLGLGHSSDETAVMYFSIGGKIQEALAEDDYDGLTYLYPQDKEVGGIMGSCATIALDDNDPKGPLMALLGFCLVFFLDRLRKTQIGRLVANLRFTS